MNTADPGGNIHGMSDIAAARRERIVDLAEEAFGTSTRLIDYQAMVGLISRVAAPGNHVDQAIELITQRRDEAATIARRDFEQLRKTDRNSSSSPSHATSGSPWSSRPTCSPAAAP
jgi:hypothetical protein